MITLYGHPNTRSLRISWLLEELGLEWAYEKVELAALAHKSESFLALNAGGKVPVLKDGDCVLSESGAMALYLLDQYAAAESSLAPPASAAAKAVEQQWVFFALTELEQPLWTIGKAKFALPKEQRAKEIIPVASWEYQQALELLSKGLGDQTFIGGDRFSVADIFLVHTLVWGVSFKQPLEQDNLRRYMERCMARPAFAAAADREAA